MADGLRIVTAVLEPGDRIFINLLPRVRPVMKVNPTVSAMVPD